MSKPVRGPEHFIQVGDRKIGDGAPVFVIAEAGVNHNGDLGLAMRLVEAAVEAGADAVKFQTFKAETLVSRRAVEPKYFELIRQLEMPLEQQKRLLDYCRERKILGFSTPCDEASADFLESLDVPLFKVASMDLNNLPFLRHLARKSRPIILSTGMGTLDEVRDAVAAIRAEGDVPLALLHCVSAYPTPVEDANLRAMDTLRAVFEGPVGFSDHTLGMSVALAAVARGAAVIEKHFTLDKSLPGPDHQASLDPAEFGAMVAAIRGIERALGDGGKRPMPSEEGFLRLMRKSLVAARRIRAGETITPDALAAKRPGTGISPAEIHLVVGRIAKRDFEPDELIDRRAI